MGELEELQKRWDDSYSHGEPFSGAANDFPSEARETAIKLRDALITLQSQFAQVNNAVTTAPSSAAVETTIAGGLEAVRMCLPLLVAAVDAKHGAGSVDSAGFRTSAAILERPSAFQASKAISPRHTRRAKRAAVATMPARSRVNHVATQTG
jgi:hypothetical protein